MTLGRTARAAAGTLLFLPSLALAQRGLPGRGRFGGPTKENPLTVPQMVNPVNLVIQHRQELVLTDTQFVQVIHVKRQLDSTNVPLMRRLDSLQRVFKGGEPIFGGASRARRDSLAEANAVMNETVTAVRTNLADARDRAYALLTPAQLTRAQTMESNAERAVAETQQGGRQ